MGRCLFTRTDECARDRRITEALTKLSPEALSGWRLFDSSGTQWRTDFGAFTGLDYAGVRAVAEALRIPWDDETLQYVGHLEVLRLTRQAEEAEAKKVAGGGR